MKKATVNSKIEGGGIFQNGGKKIIKIKDGRQSYLKPRVVHPEYG